MNDPDPLVAQSPRRPRRGLLAWLDFFRRTAEARRADEGPAATPRPAASWSTRRAPSRTLRVEDVMKPRADIVGHRAQLHLRRGGGPLRRGRAHAACRSTRRRWTSRWASST